MPLTPIRVMALRKAVIVLVLVNAFGTEFVSSERDY